MSQRIFTIDCSKKKVQHLFDSWPEEFESHSGKYFLHDHNFVNKSHCSLLPIYVCLHHVENEIIYILSHNNVVRLQQFPTANALLFFTCRHCEISSFVVGTFIDSPNVVLLDLAYNKITSDSLNPEIFRGPFSEEKYSPIKLQILDLSHNQINFLDKLIFEHTPDLKKLDLSYNELNSLDDGTNEAIASLEKLEILDLSYTGIMELPNALFINMKRLSELFINGNNFLSVPESLALVSQSLEYLQLSDNPIEQINHESFTGMLKLDKLNISSMSLLSLVEEKAFEPLKSLEVLHCKGNKKLNVIDVQSLLHKAHLKELDISYNNLTTLNIEFENLTESEGKFFEHLHLLKLAGNPWNCDCKLMRSLEVFNQNSTYFQKSLKSDAARCSTPYDLASTHIYELPKKYNCMADYKNKPLKIPVYDPPQFLRPKSIMLTIFSVVVVVVVGIIIGCLIVCIKRRLKPNQFGNSSNPIRYTAVRDSTISNRASVQP